MRPGGGGSGTGPRVTEVTPDGQSGAVLEDPPVGTSIQVVVDVVIVATTAATRVRMRGAPRAASGVSVTVVDNASPMMCGGGRGLPSGRSGHRGTAALSTAAPWDRGRAAESALFLNPDAVIDPRSLSSSSGALRADPVVCSAGRGHSATRASPGGPSVASHGFAPPTPRRWDSPCRAACELGQPGHQGASRDCARPCLTGLRRVHAGAPGGAR